MATRGVASLPPIEIVNLPIRDLMLPGHRGGIDNVRDRLIDMAFRLATGLASTDDGCSSVKRLPLRQVTLLVQVGGCY